MSAPAPTVSIVVPLYNKEESVARSLDSILAQTFEDFEIVVVDDGSTDRSAQIVASYDDPRIRLLRQENIGTGKTRNRGIREGARSKYLAFMDADDEWLSNYLEHQLNNLAEHPTCRLSVCSSYIGPEKRERSPDFTKVGVTEGEWRLPVDVQMHTLKASVDFMHSGHIVCERQIVEDLGGFYDKVHITYGEDVWIWLLVTLNHKMYRDFTPLAWFHEEDSQQSRGRENMRTIWPFLTDGDFVRQHCPTEYRDMLDHCLGFYAMLGARRLVQFGEYQRAWELLRTHPKSRSFGRRSLKIYSSVLPRALWDALPIVGNRHSKATA